MRKLLAVLLLACVVLFACKKGNENFVSTTTLLNTAVGMPAISLNLNGNVIIANVPYDSIRYNVSNPSGTYTLTFTATGVTNPLYSVNTGFSSGSGYTAIVYDSASPVLAANNSRLYFQKDNIPTSVTDKKSAIRFFNLIPNSSSIYFANDTGSYAGGTGGKVFLSARTFGDFGSSNAFAEVDTTTNTTIRILNDTAKISTARFDSVSVKLDTYSAGLKNGKIYTFYLLGTIGGTGSQKPHLVVHQHN